MIMIPRYGRTIQRSFLLISSLCMFGLSYAQMAVKTAWADYECDDPLAEHIIQSPVMQRIKDIAVAGPTYYLGLVPEYSRYNHCIGVWWLLKEKAHAPVEEQLAGLLHDTSHTAFSHLGDIVFGKGDGDKSYQDTIHLWFLRHYQDLVNMLESHGLSLERMDPDCHEYQALEQPLPNLCADRIEYNLHTGIVFGRLQKNEAQALVDALVYQDECWAFVNQEAAYQFARLPIYFTYTTWGSPYNVFVYHCFSRIVQQAIAIGLLNRELMHFGGDSQVMQAIMQSNDLVIKEWFDRAVDHANQYQIVPYGEGAVNVKPKCRAVDPLVLHEGNYCRLSSLNVTFARELHEVQQWCRVGYGITFAL